mmetsp:Transcript_7373/g.19186  ORF Transcript_7373/g.19186 Transcript_7373/m.19186 type:complete len:404 (+) Transcript_7373:186-1397(+)
MLGRLFASCSIPRSTKKKKLAHPPPHVLVRIRCQRLEELHIRGDVWHAADLTRRHDQIHAGTANATARVTQCHAHAANCPTEHRVCERLTEQYLQTLERRASHERARGVRRKVVRDAAHKHAHDACGQQLPELFEHARAAAASLGTHLRTSVRHQLRHRVELLLEDLRVRIRVVQNTKRERRHHHTAGIQPNARIRRGGGSKHHGLVQSMQRLVHRLADAGRRQLVLVQSGVEHLERLRRHLHVRRQHRAVEQVAKHPALERQQVRSAARAPCSEHHVTVPPELRGRRVGDLRLDARVHLLHHLHIHEHDVAEELAPFVRAKEAGAHAASQQKFFRHGDALFVVKVEHGETVAHGECPLDVRGSSPAQCSNEQEGKALRGEFCDDDAARVKHVLRRASSGVAR